ncbi:hypothetical protein PoB_004730700 [Plakobranchus ocellatus]|uniref:Uncharacterized protein n=1 Tax=Plakobranchus ocellatus TaxID=259542 RepID=A0AAV4BN26_9GAST|nr:hypothetical protein PoB_004730700 [Plakobranchus ocellatus]
MWTVVPLQALRRAGDEIVATGQPGYGGTDGKTRTHHRRALADLRAGSLFPVPPTPCIQGEVNSVEETVLIYSFWLLPLKKKTAKRFHLPAKAIFSDLRFLKKIRTIERQKSRAGIARGNCENQTLLQNNNHSDKRKHYLLHGRPGIRKGE